ncbi:MAG: hypothetical protein GY950_02475 [bacterium]|nr:hypothetical protein [bacterium]
MLNDFAKKCLFYAAVVLLITVGVTTTASANEVFNINTWTSFTTIQDAIDAPTTLNGHSLFVVPDTPYNENVVVYKSVKIIGDYHDPPVVDGSASGHVFSITADGVTIKWLTIQNAGAVGTPLYAGVYINSDNNLIECNTILDCPKGVYSYGYHTGNDVSNNTITCDLGNYFAGIHLGGSEHKVYLNEITGPTERGMGIFLSGASDNYIVGNTSQDNDYGIFLFNSSNDNYIHNNNFIDNDTYHAYIENSIYPCTGNKWDNGLSNGGNYWGTSTPTDPYPIQCTGGTCDYDQNPLTAQWSNGSNCGDVNDDNAINIGDVIYLNNYLNNGKAAPVPICAGDVDGDGDVDDDDVDYLIDYIFYYGPAPVGNCCNCAYL